MRLSASIGTVVAGAVSLGLSACGKPEPPKAVAPPFQGVQVVVGAVGDPAVLATVDAQRGEWEASRGASCRIQKDAVDPASTGSAHVVVFRADLLGEFVDAQNLIVLPESLVRPPVRPEDAADPPEKKEKDEPAEVDAFQLSDIIPAFREQVPKYGKDRMAFPYGGSALVLAYRPEAFERKENRAAAKQAGISLEPPTTWEQLDKLVTFFQGRDWSGDGAKDFGIALALGADPEGVGDATYLARAASLGQHRDQYSLVFSSDTMEPRIATPPFVEALEKLVALKACGPAGIETFDIDAARKAFRKGNVAMLIDRAERPASWSEGGALVSVAVLPGSNRVYDPASKRWNEQPTPNRPSYLPFGGGWLVGVASSAQGKEREAAIDFAKYLVSPDTASRVRSDRAFPMLPVRSSQAGQGLPDPTAAPGVDSRLWADAVSKTLNAARVVPGLRIPQAEGYLADLEKGRVAAVKGEPAEKALEAVAESWKARTKALGVARQVWHYQKSLNSIITAPNPPAR
jgi:multiple sugar transport system substrate-binding protein